MSFRENHWRGLADHHTVAFTDVVTHAVKPTTYTTARDVTLVWRAVWIVAVPASRSACGDEKQS